MRLSLFILLIISLYCQAQVARQTYSGYVSDSVSLAPLVGVHVRTKNSFIGTITNDKGFFTIEARRTDTLVFTQTGYLLYELPLFFEENVLLIRMREKVVYLDEVKITGARITEGTRPVRPLPKPLPESTAFSSPIEYFSRYQRERRKLLLLVEENNRIYLYNQVINDEHLRKELMEEFNLTETTYYNLLVKFNERYRQIQYISEREKIIEALRQFLQQQTR